MSEKQRKDALSKDFVRAGEIARNLTYEKLTDIQERFGNLSNFFEQEDPSMDYGANMPFDAFERAMLTCKIIPRSVPEYGITASKLGDMGSHDQARYLIGEFMGRQWRGVAFGNNNRAPLQSQDSALGTFMNQYAFPSSPRFVQVTPAIPLSELIAITTGIDKTYYKPFYLEDVSQTEDVLARIAEGAEVPAIKISTHEKTINLKKTGRRIDTTYEALRQVPIDLMAYLVQRIAIKSEADKVNRVIDIIINGDGNSGTAATNYDLTDLDTAATVLEPTIKAYLSWKMQFDNPFVLTHIFGKPASILALMLLNSGSANIPLALAGSVFAGQQFTPINRNLGDGVRAGWLAAPPTNVVVGIDARVAVERVYEVAGTIREVDRWIREQKESLVMTEMEGYAINEPRATKTLDLNA